MACAPEIQSTQPKQRGAGCSWGGCDDVDGAHSCPESKSHTVSSELLGWERLPGGPRWSHWGHLSVQAKSPVSVQLLNCVRLFATWNLLKLTSIESMMPSNHLILCHPLLLLLSIFPSFRVFSNESVLRIRWPKYWSFSFSISTSNEYSGLISFRTNWFDLLTGPGTLKNLLQHHNWKASIHSLALRVL